MDQRLATWCESVKAILVLLARQLGKVPESLGGICERKRVASGYETNSVDQPWSFGGEVGCVLGGGTVETVATPSPRDVATLLHWRSMMHLLAEAPE